METDDGHIFTFRTDATGQEIRAAGAQLLESYESFAVGHGSLANMAVLRAHGRYAEPLARSSVLELAAGPVDIATLASRSPASWSTDFRGKSVGVVHFRAPIKPDWRTDLESRGLTVLRYLPHDAFIVRGRPSDLRAASYLPHVDWAGPYEAAWKIRPGTEDRGIADVRIVTFPGDSPEAVEAWLGHAGIRPASVGSNVPAVSGTSGTGDFRWVRARIPTTLISSLAALPAVEFIDPVHPIRFWNAETNWVIQTNRPGDYRFWTYGLNASGQVIGMADTGLDYDGDQFRHSSGVTTLGDIYNVTDGTRRKVTRYVNMGVLTGQVAWPGDGGPWDPFSIKDCANGHGTGVASTLAGNDNGISPSPTSPNDGNALMARIYLQDVGGFQGGANCPKEGLIYIPENYHDLFGPAGLVYNDPISPVRVHSDSWGADTNVYDVQARMVDAFVWAHPDMTILFAVGNCLPPRVGCPLAGSIGTPATAKNVIAVGGAYNPNTGAGLDQNDLAPQSSRGPTSDGRIAPTIVTIFNGDSAMSDGDPLSGTGLPDAPWAGTSYATPAAAAAAAIIRQYFADGWYPSGAPVAANSMNASAALIRAILIASGQQVTGSGTVVRSGADTWPNNEQGFGRVLLSSVLPIAAAGDTFRTEVIDSTSGLLTGDDAVYSFRTGVSGPMKFALAWSDYPGSIGASKALVNDLDLEVTAPDGTQYRGNNFAVFARGESLPGGTFDATNVEEAVILRNAMVGEWTVRIIGSNVPVGPQPFAFVASGNLDGSYGQVVMDRVAYSEADTIRLVVDDPDATSVVVRLTSGIESAGEDVTLLRGGPDEVWRGSLTTAFGTASADGVLQVREGDTVTAFYQDASPPHTATAKARILASGPTIHDVRVTDIDAKSATVRWATNEPASAQVRYATSPAPLTLDVSQAELRTDHAISLTNLTPETLYYFEVASRGRLGNATTDTNGGRLYTFRTTRMGDVLFVVGGDSFPPEREASYAAALDSNGWTWSLWRVAELGFPPLPVMQSSRAVIWQVGLEQYPPFNASARSLVKNYLDGGGRLFVSSHDATWALSSPDSTFASPESEEWIRGVLKATFVCDPTTIRTVDGVNGDPISGAYIDGVAYTPHREGGADDEFSANAAGGTSSVVWRDDSGVQGCSPQDRPVGLRWVSSAANGTIGAGAWGGHPSRLVYFAFELTGVDATQTNLNLGSFTRAAILDAALVWLVNSSTGTVDRDHPDVAITSPNGGAFTGSSITIDWVATAYGTGIGIVDFTLSSSADGGQTWTTIATLPETNRTYTWDIGAVPNGARYLLRIETQDDGTPSLSGADTTDGTLTIRRPGGDADGPLLWTGSVRVNPLPPGAGFLTTFTATADDRTRGASAIAAAELFLQIPQPVAADTGTGLPMMAADGAFDAVVENVSWQDRFPEPPGATCAWVHALDGSGNWGPFMSVCFVVIVATNQPPTVSIQSPTEGQAFPASSNITFRWTMSDDLFLAADLPVWANVTIGNETIPLLENVTGATSTVWTSPDLAVDRAVFHLDVLDPSGLRASAERTFSLTRASPPSPPSPLAIVIAALIVVVLLAFLVFGFLRARRSAERPPTAAPAPPPPAVGAPMPVAGTKVCPRCHTTVNAIDVTCFFCGYLFQEETRSPPYR